jgi:serine/threonine-protein kinase
MPYMRRGTLLDRLAQGPLTEAEMGAILAQLADALGIAHALGIIHRDIKPSNILLGEQCAVYLADFGVATATGRDPITREDILLGTPYYMAPELIDESATILSDIYAIGVLSYQLLTGHLPFQGKNPLEICWKHAHLPPPPLTLRNPALSSEIEQVVLRAMEKNPRQRFQSVQEMEQAYREALTKSMTKPQKVLLPSLPHGFEKAVTLVVVANHLTHPAVVAPPSKREFPATRLAIASLMMLVLLFAVSLSTGFLVPGNRPSARPATITKVEAQPTNSNRPPLKKPSSVTFQPSASDANSATVRNEDNHGIKHKDGSGDDGDNGHGKGDGHGSGKGGGDD